MTKIEWADVTWNPVTGCTPISEGCQNCYAKRMSNRLRGRCGYPDDEPFRVTIHHDKLQVPLKWKKPRRIFVNSMSDLFHEDVPFEFIDHVFANMLAHHIWNNVAKHIFMILTKRPERMKEYFSEGAKALLKRWAKTGDGWLICDNPDILFSELVESAVCHDWNKFGRNSSGSSYKPWGYLNQLWPLPNVWLGVTAENQEQADKRIPILLQIPAAVRFVSVEPMLGPVDLTRIEEGFLDLDCLNGKYTGPNGEDNLQMKTTRLDWIICGGETGPGARPMHPDWVRSLKDQCQKAGTPFFFKQWGEWGPVHELRIKNKLWHNFDPDTSVCRVGKKSAGRLLDGQTWEELPEVERVNLGRNRHK